VTSLQYRDHLRFLHPVQECATAPARPIRDVARVYAEPHIGARVAQHRCHPGRRLTRGPGIRGKRVPRPVHRAAAQARLRAPSTRVPGAISAPTVRASLPGSRRLPHGGDSRPPGGRTWRPVGKGQDRGFDAVATHAAGRQSGLGPRERRGQSHAAAAGRMAMGSTMRRSTIRQSVLRRNASM